MKISELLREAIQFEKLAQISTDPDILALQNLLKHEPYSYGGKPGTLYGTLTLHSQTERLVNPNSGVMAKILEMATIAKATGAIVIQMNVTNQGMVKLTGGPPGLIMKLNQIFAPLIQAAITRLKAGPSVDKDCAGIKLPVGGIKFDWIKFNMPVNPSIPVQIAT